MNENPNYFKDTYPELYQQVIGLRTNPDDWVIRCKQIVKDKLIHDPRIIHFLHNEELDEAYPDTYVGVNILQRVNLPDTQSKVKNYICFKVDLTDVLEYNKAIARLNVTFQILCRDDDLDTKLGIDRHDLLGYCLIDTFHTTNILGAQALLVYDQETLTDSNYNGRLIKFEMEIPNYRAKTTPDGIHRNRNIGVRE